METTLEYPPRKPGLLYLTEGGVETEIMYKWGHKLPHFAMFTLLDKPEAMADMKSMFARALEVAATQKTGLVLSSLDYRASPDWAALLGISADGLRDVHFRTVAFMKEVAAPFVEKIPDLVFSGVIGPRGDAYGKGGGITEEEAEDYHTPQLKNLRDAGADMACALTFNNIPEAVGVARAAKAVGIPLGLYFTLNSKGTLGSGPTLKEAVESVEEITQGAPSYYGLNCSHPLEFMESLEDGDWLKRVRSIRPNAVRMEKVALCKLGHLEDGDPEELGQQMGDIRQKFPQMDILGGCCGTDERHLGEIAKNALAASP
jgi:S-methylmethionine-dependent homocysteine/selenocysteine methylase